MRVEVVDEVRPPAGYETLRFGVRREKEGPRRTLRFFPFFFDVPPRVAHEARENVEAQFRRAVETAADRP